MSNGRYRLRSSPGLSPGEPVSDIGPFIEVGLALVGAVSAGYITDAQVVNANFAFEGVKERLRLDEMATLRLDSSLALMKNEHGHVVEDLSEIKRNQVPRQEWEAQMKNVTDRLSEIIAKLPRGSASSGGYSQTRLEEKR